MQTDTLIRFLIATAVVTVIPGPNILLITHDSIRSGVRNGLMTALGVTIGMIPLFVMSLAGVSTLLKQSPWLFDAIRVIGLAYLLYLGGGMIVSAVRSGGSGGGPGTPAAAPAFSANRFMMRGILVCITNPKGLFFAGAFFPQFLDPVRPLLPQVLILCSGCLAVATLIGGGYAVFAGTADTLFQSRRFERHSAWLSGTVLILFGISFLFM